MDIVKLYELIQKKNDPELNEYLGLLKEMIDKTPAVTTEFSELKKLLESNQWPPAVDPSLICDANSESDKLDRAEGILDLLVEESLENKRFLDFGCGEGHVPFKAAEKAALSVGYDIEAHKNWSELKHENLTFTSDLNTVTKLGPYNVILVYDVLDHMPENLMQSTLDTVTSLLQDNGTIYLRVHPYCSKHATHLYRKINKAYIHLVFTEDELKELGHDNPATAKIIFPLWKYGDLIKNSKLKTENSSTLRESVEDFFKSTPVIRNRIRKAFPKEKKFPDFQCEQQFLDFILKKII